MHLNSILLGLLLMIYKKAYLQHYKSLPLFEKSRVYIYGSIALKKKLFSE